MGGLGEMYKTLDLEIFGKAADQERRLFCA